MQVHVTFRNTEATDALKNYAVNKLQRVSRLLIKPEEAQVVLAVEKFRHTAEFVVNANGERFVSVEQSKDMYEAIDLALDRLENQLRRYKDRYRDHKGDGPPEGVVDGDSGAN